jgi:hypothetical protein
LSGERPSHLPNYWLLPGKGCSCVLLLRRSRIEFLASLPERQKIKHKILLVLLILSDRSFPA